MIYGTKNEFVPLGLHYGADGEQEFEDEEYTEYEGEASSFPEEEFSETELPKFRHLVRAKKLEMKAQYGKAHIGTTTKTIQVPSTCYRTVNVPYPCPTIKQPLKTCYRSSSVPYPCTKDQTINVPIWVWGWRKKWREFKQSGGLAQLKMQSKGMAPIPGYTDPAPTTSPTPKPPKTPALYGPKGVGVESEDSNDGGALGVNQAHGMSTTMKVAIAVPVLIGLGFGLYKLLK